MNKKKLSTLTHDQLLAAIQSETHKFQEFYTWLEKSMPPQFFEEINYDNLMLITHSLMGFHLQEYFSTIHLRRAAIVLCLDSPEADLQIFEELRPLWYQILSHAISPIPSALSSLENANLRIALIYFTEAVETVDQPFPESVQKMKLQEAGQN